MLSFKNFLNEEAELLLMSAASDAYENAVAEYLDNFIGVSAVRPVASPKFPDVFVRRTVNKNSNKMAKSWIEVKMNHTDNLGNTRVSYIDGKWTAAAPLDPIKIFAIEYLTNSKETQDFLKDIAKFAGIKDWKNMTVPSTKGALSKPNAVSRQKMAEYFKNKNQYILSVPGVDLGKLVTRHYLEAKAEPAHYLQAGDDFYMIGNANPLSLPNDIPVLGVNKKCEGTFKMRIGVRSQYYEVQPEIKIQDMGKSKYSVRPGTTKMNPFGDKQLPPGYNRTRG
jgi:hypothetical protein